MEKRIIPACLINNQLKSLIEEVESHDIYNNFKIKCLNKDDFFKVKSSFVMMDEDILFEIIEKKIFFRQIILIRESDQKLQSSKIESEIISIRIPFKFSELYQIISNRLSLIASQNERLLKFNYFSYDPRMRSLFNKNFSLRFTEKEANIFEYLLQNPNQYLSKKILLKEIWSYTDSIDTHTLETHIYSLRKKVSENLTLKKLINFEEKKGYFLDKNIL